MLERQRRQRLLLRLDSTANPWLSWQGSKNKRKISIPYFRAKVKNTVVKGMKFKPTFIECIQGFHLSHALCEGLNDQWSVQGWLTLKSWGKAKEQQSWGAGDQALNKSVSDGNLMAWAGCGGVTYRILPRKPFRLTYFNKSVQSFCLNAGNKIS